MIKSMWRKKLKMSFLRHLFLCELRIVKSGIEAARPHKLAVASLLYDVSVLHDKDQVGILYR